VETDSSAAKEKDYSSYDPMSVSVRGDPYPYYRYMRQNEPVKYLPDLNAYAISRSEDVRTVLLDYETFSSDPLIQLAFGEGNPAPDAQYMIACDPPDHTRLRTLVNKAFSRRMLESKRGEIAIIVGELIEQAAASNEFEFVDAIASPLPVQIVGQIMGIETSMRATFRRWSNNVTAGGNAETLTDSQRDEIRSDANDFREYFTERIAYARRRPQDDLISALVETEESGDQLHADEVLAMCILLLIAGNETTTSLLANTLVCLREFPEQETLVRSDRSLVGKLTEESLRYLSPVQLLFRRATQATEICGTEIPENAIVVPIYASANRDESVFSDPDVINVMRTDLRHHIAFSWGIHMCVGRALALLEGELALNQLFDRFKTIEIVQGDIAWCEAFYLRSPKALQVRCS
jgi:cytochrome P450